MFTIPQVGTKGIFVFKDPFDSFVSNMLNVDSQPLELTVVSIISMKDHILVSKRDPFTEIYTKVGLDEIEYKQDLKDEVKLITFLYIDEYDSERMFRIPANYVELKSNPSTIEYAERVIVLGLPSVPMDLDLSPIFEELKDVVSTQIGVTPTIKDVVSSALEFVTEEEHASKETIRKNNTKVFKTLSTRLSEVTTHRDELLLWLSKNKVKINFGGKK